MIKVVLDTNVLVSAHLKPAIGVTGLKISPSSSPHNLHPPGSVAYRASGVEGLIIRIRCLAAASASIAPYRWLLHRYFSNTVTGFKHDVLCRALSLTPSARFGLILWSGVGRAVALLRHRVIHCICVSLNDRDH
jgi:hypothetical protein